MLDILQFVFSSFWVWLGTMIMLSIIVKGVAVIVLGTFGMVARSVGQIGR